MALGLLLGSSLMAALGLIFLSNATVGVGLIGFACWLAILARLAQAAQYRKRDLAGKPDHPA